MLSKRLLAFAFAALPATVLACGDGSGKDNCSAHGKCVHGYCVCDRSYGGHDCGMYFGDGPEPIAQKPIPTSHKTPVTQAGQQVHQTVPQAAAATAVTPIVAAKEGTVTTTSADKAGKDASKPAEKKAEQKADPAKKEEPAGPADLVGPLFQR